MKRILLLLTLLPLGLAAQSPDNQPGQRRQFPGDRIVGKVTAVDKDSLTVAPLGGDAGVDVRNPVTIKVSENTRINKQREPIKLSDVKPGDTVFAVGHRDGNTVEAGMLGVVPPEMIARMSGGQGGGGRMAFGQGGQFDPADLGKKYIVGTVKAINETKLTIARTDGQTQEIEVDENTSFRKFRESITLPDIKVGDMVMGRGELKNNVFVPKTLNVASPQSRLHPGPAEAGAPQPSASPSKDAPPLQ